MLRVLYRRLRAWDPNHSRHPRLVAAAIPLLWVVIFAAGLASFLLGGPGPPR